MHFVIGIAITVYYGYMCLYRVLHRRIVGKRFIWIWPVQCLDKNCLDHPRPRDIARV